MSLIKYVVKHIDLREYSGHHSAFDESVYIARGVDARIAKLERALRQMLALVDEIDTSSGEEVKGVVYYEAKKLVL